MSVPLQVVLSDDLHPLRPGVSLLISPLSIRFEEPVLLLVVLRALRPCVAVVAEVAPQALAFADWPVGYTGEDVVLFKAVLSSAEVALPLVLQNAFPHCDSNLSSSSLLTGIIKPMFVMSCFR